MDQTACLIEWLQSLDLRKVRNIDELNVAIALQIAAIDRQFVSLVRQVLHDPAFQRMEASYRSILNLAQMASQSGHGFRNAPSSRQVNVFVLDISAEELQSDLEASSWRQTWIYDKLFKKRFDYLVGEQNIDVEAYSAIYPFSLMLVDFDFTLKEDSRKTEQEKASQIGLGSLRKLARIGEECFCMFLLSLAPSFFGDSFKAFSQLENVIDVRSILLQSRFDQWNEFRRQDYARMVGISFPRVLVREPYRNYRMGGASDSDGNEIPATGIVFNQHDGFCKTENLLWGSSAFAVVEPIIRSFKQYDWFSDVSGIDRDSKQLETSDEPAEPGYDGGLIGGLPEMYFGTDEAFVASYSPAEIVISEIHEAIYASLGLISIFSINQSPYVAMLSSQSVQQTKEMSKSAAAGNLRLSAMFNYMLCVCRMAHRLKIECRSLIGKSSSPDDVQDHMQQWLMQHASGQNRGFEQKMVKPFLDEQTGFVVYEDVTDPGKYDCTVQLCPHHKYDSGRTRLIFEPVSLQMQLNASEDGE